MSENIYQEAVECLDKLNRLNNVIFNFDKDLSKALKINRNKLFEHKNFWTGE